MKIKMHDVTEISIPDKSSNKGEKNFLVRLKSKENHKIKFHVMSMMNDYALIGGHFDFDILSMYDITHWVEIEND